MVDFTPTAWVSHVLAAVASMQGWVNQLQTWWSGTMGSGSKLVAPLTDVSAALTWAWQWIPLPLRYVLVFAIALGVVRLVMTFFGYGKTLIKWW
jgi:hypothetical protein